MTHDEYWYGDPWMVRDYLKADEFRREKANYDAWLHGLYVASAIDSTVGNAFRKEHSQPSEYPDKPFPLFESEEEEEEREQKNLDAAELYLKQFIEFGKKWGKKDDAQTPPSA